MRMISLSPVTRRLLRELVKEIVDAIAHRDGYCPRCHRSDKKE